MASFFQHSLTRDCVFHRKGDSFTVKLHSSLVASGWDGCQFVKWFDDGTGEPCVKKADGRYCGILAYGSGETGDMWTSFTGQNLRYGYGVITFGGNIFSTRRYERYGFLARNGLGPTVPLVYMANQLLFISENGLITTENESDLGVYGAHNYPDGTPVVDMTHGGFGVVAVPPSMGNESMGSTYLVVQSTLGL